jgi:ADP-ribose pyrophosphatase YjhB (NUDIX family)
MPAVDAGYRLAPAPTAGPASLDFVDCFTEDSQSMFKVSIKGVLVAPDGRIVLLQNERDEWELPGGQIELGESPAQCLAREIREELRLEVEVGRPLDTYLFEVTPGRHVFIVTYECALIGPFGPTVSHEHKGIGLFSEDCLPEDLPTGYKASIASAMRSPNHSLQSAGLPTAGDTQC